MRVLQNIGKYLPQAFHIRAQWHIVQIKWKEDFIVPRFCSFRLWCSINNHLLTYFITNDSVSRQTKQLIFHLSLLTIDTLCCKITCPVQSHLLTYGTYQHTLHSR